MKNEARPIDANALAQKIKEYMEDFPNAETRLAACRAVLSMLGDEGQTPTLTDHFPNLTKMVPLTLEQLREMDGRPVLLVFDFELEPMIALIEYVEAADCIILTNNLGGRSEFYSDEELRESGIKVYAYPPAHIDREAWTAEWKRTYKSGIHAGNGYVCSNCDMWNNRPSWFCTSCGRAMTPEAWAELEKRMGVRA